MEEATMCWEALLNDEFGQVKFARNVIPSTLEQDMALPWKRERVTMRGKEMDAPRFTLAFGDPGVSYSYAGQCKRAAPWPPHLLK
jgi:alkylated DNA repair dioxygenase AlkB